MLPDLTLFVAEFEVCFALLRDAPANVNVDFAEKVSKYQLSSEHEALIRKAVLVPPTAVEKTDAES